MLHRSFRCAKYLRFSLANLPITLEHIFGIPRLSDTHSQLLSKSIPLIPGLVFQEAYFGYADDQPIVSGANQIDHDVLYRSVLTSKVKRKRAPVKRVSALQEVSLKLVVFLQGAQTYAPRVLIYDLKGICP